MRALILVALLMAGPTFADDALTPTEGGEIAGDADQSSGPTGCHRCVGNPDGGWSDSDYSNPEGKWTTSAGDTAYKPGMSQDWYEGTGPWAGGMCTDHCEWSNAIKKQRPKASKTARAPAIGQGGRNFTNGGGNDHSKTR